jgi:predicted DNA-binding transcriptional regulator AlpA
MPVEIKGKTFYTMGEVAEVAGVVRQTIWRWKNAGKIPSGRRYRGRELLFTQSEMEKIYEYAHRLEPGDASPDFEDQMTLFT